MSHAVAYIQNSCLHPEAQSNTTAHTATCTHPSLSCPRNQSLRTTHAILHRQHPFLHTQSHKHTATLPVTCSPQLHRSHTMRSHTQATKVTHTVSVTQSQSQQPHLMHTITETCTVHRTAGAEASWSWPLGGNGKVSNSQLPASALPPLGCTSLSTLFHPHTSCHWGEGH